MTFSEVKQTVDPTRIGAEIGILVYPNSQAAAVHGLTDLFCAANAIHRARGGSPYSEISVSHWKLNEDSVASDESTPRTPAAPKARGCHSSTEHGGSQRQ
jgi:transcriptional regulator GlxA family with amidase domain